MTGDTENKFSPIAGGFIPCPKCGELIRSESEQCRFCGNLIVEPVNSIAIPDSNFNQPPNNQPYYNQTISDVPSGDDSHSDVNIGGSKIKTKFRTSDGMVVPPEYGSSFNPKSFSWCAFLFADLWHAEKGLKASAVKHFILRAIGTLFGVSGVILMLKGFSGTEPGDPSSLISAGFGFVMLLISFGFLFAIILMGHIDASSAHQRYIHAYNSWLKDETANETSKSSERVYWFMLYSPFVIFLILFLFALASASP